MSDCEKLCFNLDLDTDGRLNDKHVKIFSESNHFDEVYIGGQGSFLVGDAKKLERIRSVSSITIWCDTTRSAVRSLISRPNLEELIIFGLKPYGQFVDFEDAENLEHFSCLHELHSSDLLEISKLPKLRKLGAQMAHLTEEAVLALLDKPLLKDIDFEGSNFDDDLAALIARSTTITTLELGATKLTNIGLEKICSMKQLVQLDIWGTEIDESGVDLLAQLRNLEYLSIGGHENQTKFTAKETLPKLYKLPALKRVWLDGFRITKEEWRELNQRFEHVQVTEVTD